MLHTTKPTKVDVTILFKKIKIHILEAINGPDSILLGDPNSEYANEFIGLYNR